MTASSIGIVGNGHRDLELIINVSVPVCSSVAMVNGVAALVSNFTLALTSHQHYISSDIHSSINGLEPSLIRGRLEGRTT